MTARPPGDDSSARRYCFNLLARRPYSRGELRQRLARRGYHQETVEATLGFLEERRLVDDREFGRQFVQSRLTGKPAGRRYFQFHLERRGLDRALAGEIVDDILPPEREEALAREMAAGLCLDSTNGRRKAYRTLLRRGFPHDVSRRAMGRALESEDPEPL